MKTSERPLKWVGSSYKDLLALPPEVRKTFGFALIPFLILFLFGIFYVLLVIFSLYFFAKSARWLCRQKHYGNFLDLV